jgi:hypothetical protein
VKGPRASRRALIASVMSMVISGMPDKDFNGGVVGIDQSTVVICTW